MRKLLTPLAIAAISISAPARADTTIIEVPTDAAWEHKWSDASMPAQLGSFDRRQVEQIGENEVDVISTYVDNASKTEASVYLFRAGLVDAAVWHDRIYASIAARPLFAKSDFAAMSTAAFAPPVEGSINSGLRSSISVDGDQFSTGMAVFPMGDWFVSVRMTSRGMDQAGLDEALSEFVDAMKIDESAKNAPAASAILPCADNLTLKKAKRVKPNLTDSLMGALLGQVIGKMADSDAAEPNNEIKEAVTYCRDGAKGQQYGVYRPNGSNERYVMAFGDAGIAAFVGQNDLGGLVGDKKAKFGVSLVTHDARLTYTPFRSLPRPKQVADVIMKERPSASSGRTLGDEETKIELQATE